MDFVKMAKCIAPIDPAVTMLIALYEVSNPSLCVETRVLQVNIT